MPAGAYAFGETGAERQALKVDALGGFLGAGYLLTHEDQSSSDIQRNESRLEERIGAGARGSVYSPSFLRYDLTGVFGLTQDWARDSDGSDFDTGQIREGVAGVDLFPTRFHPARFYFTRTEDIQPRVFFSKLESTTTTAGATQDLRGDNGGVRFDYEHRKFDQKVFAAENLPFLDVTEDTAGVSGDYRLSDRQSVSASYRFLDTEQARGQGSFSSHSFLGTHIAHLGSRRRHDLRSRFEAVSQSGSLDQQLLRWNEDLTSRITDTLDGDLRFLAERNDTDIVKIEQIDVNGGLTHRLFESLTSSIRLQGGRSQTDDSSTTDTFSGTASINYHKKTPWGVYRLVYSSFLERRLVENDQGGAVDEPHTFPVIAPEEVRLLRPFVERSSITVTDTTGRIFYTEGIDYTLREDSAGFTVITRVFAGTIPLGGSILVDYRFRNGSDFTLDTLTQRLRTEHEFHNGLTPYFALYDQDQGVSSVKGPGGIEPVRERSLIGGLEWRGGDYLLGGEYENRESTVLPFDAVRLRAQATLRLQDLHQLTGTATQAWLFFREPSRDVVTFQANARWRTRFARDTSFFLDTALRHDDDSLVGESLGFSVRAGLEYRWRRFRIIVDGAHRETRGVTSDFISDELGIRIVREFGVLPQQTSAAENRFLRQ